MMNLKSLYRKEHTPPNSQEGRLNINIQRAATSWSDEFPDRREIGWQIAKTCRYAMWLAIETDKEDWECLSEAIRDSGLHTTVTILAIMDLSENTQEQRLQRSQTGPASIRTCEAGTWIMELKDGRKIPFYKGVSDKNPLFGDHAILSFDKGTHWEITADKKFKLYSSLGGGGKPNGKSIVQKRNVAKVYFERYDGEIIPTDRMDTEHMNQIIETATFEYGESSEIVKLAKELAESMKVE